MRTLVGAFEARSGVFELRGATVLESFSDGTLEAREGTRISERSWNYITLGYGHGETWWRQFCTALKLAGYDDVLSIEHEDMMMSPMEGMRKSVELLRKVAINLA